MKIKPCCYFLILVCLSFFKSHAQLPITVPKNSYGLDVVTNKELYQQLIATDSSMYLVSLTDSIPGLILDLRYASKNNFMHKSMYPTNTKKTFMRLPAANALKKIEKELSLNGMHLKIFDAYRPFSVTVKFWNAVHDERYVANPKWGSGHNKGFAVDLTIVDSTGKDLDMGTGFDNFTDTAHHSFINFTTAIVENRKLLKSIMEENGFKSFDTEWWHYSWPNNINYEVMDISFKELKRLVE